MLKDALHEMVLAYKDLGKKIPLSSNPLECKIALFATAFFILIPASTWAGLIAANFLFGYL